MSKEIPQEMKAKVFDCDCDKKVEVCSIHYCPRKLPRITIEPTKDEKPIQKKWRQFYERNNL